VPDAGFHAHPGVQAPPQSMFEAVLERQDEREIRHQARLFREFLDSVDRSFVL